MSTEALATQEPLPIGGSGHHSSSWWGVWSLILTEASLFGYLLLTYFYLYSQTQNHWPPEGMPKLLIPGINTVILLLSSVFIWLGERHIKRGKRKAGMIWTVVAIIAGALFVGIQFKEWHDKPYTMTTNLYGSLYFTITRLSHASCHHRSYYTFLPLVMDGIRLFR